MKAGRALERLAVEATMKPAKDKAAKQVAFVRRTASYHVNPDEAEALEAAADALAEKHRLPVRKDGE